MTTTVNDANWQNLTTTSVTTTKFRVTMANHDYACGVMWIAVGY